MHELFYLRKTLQESMTGSDFSEILADMETTEEYIKRIKENKYTKETEKDVAFHLYQLMEIAIDCRFAYEWLCRETYNSKESFLRDIDSFEKFSELVDHKSYHFTTAEIKQFDKALAEILQDDFNEIAQELFRDICEHNKKCRNFNSEELIYSNKVFVDALISQGLFLQVGLIPKNPSNSTIAVTMKGQEIPACDFTSSPIKKYDKNARAAFVMDDIKTLYQNISNQALDDYIKVWHLLGKEDKRKNKTKMYEGMTKEELLEVFHEKYEVQDNFFKLLQKKEFSGKITFGSDYSLNNNNFLVVSYLYECAINGSDYSLLEALFNKKGLSKYVKTYKDDTFNDFKAFLKENEDF